MIYSTNNKPLVLVEAAADGFLMDMDIALYEDTIMIEGEEYEGSYGESILEANGIFLYEDGIVLEGKQAEEYRARKAEEREKRYLENERRNRPVKYQFGTTKGDWPGDYKYDKIDNDRKSRAIAMIGRAHDKHYAEYNKHNKEAQDAIHRAHVFAKKANDLNNTVPTEKTSRAHYAKVDRYNNTTDKYYNRYLDAEDKAEKSYIQSQKTRDNDVYRSTMRHLKNQDRIARSKKSTIQHNSTIFSDIEII